MKRNLIISIVLVIVLLIGLCYYIANHKNESQWITELNFNSDANATIATTTWSNPNPTSTLSDHYTTDKSHVYIDKILIKGVSSNGFKLLDDGSHNDLSFIYIRDANSIFICSTGMLMDGSECSPVKGADPESFRPLPGYFAKDDQHVFYNFEIIPNADPKTFKILTWSNYDNDYSKDAQHVFYRTQLIHSADPATFQQIDYYFSYDKSRIFCLAQPLEGLTPNKKTLYAIASSADAYNSVTISGKTYVHCQVQ